MAALSFGRAARVRRCRIKAASTMEKWAERWGVRGGENVCVGLSKR